jgi:hypothetical protein
MAASLFALTVVTAAAGNRKPETTGAKAKGAQPFSGSAFQKDGG